MTSTKYNGLNGPITADDAERGEPLFDKPATPRSPVQKVTVRLAYLDAPVDIDLAAGTSVAQIENIIAATLKRSGWKAQKPAQIAGGFGPRKPAPLPFYDGDGNPCCPHHKRLLQLKSFGGWGCNEKLPAGDEHANERGYCKYIWRDGK